MGDLDGDHDNDINDFVLFRQAYEMVHTAPGAFEEMVALYSVPEPGTGLLVLAGLILAGQRRNHRK